MRNLSLNWRGFVRTRLLAGSVAGAVLVFAAACGGGGGPAATAPSGGATARPPVGNVTPPPPAEATCIDPVTDGEQIEITEHKFPAEITVGVGDTVTFNNADNLNHTVTFRSDPDCGIMLIGQSISVSLEGPGTYQYYCQFHSPTMRGTIIVE